MLGHPRESEPPCPLQGLVRLTTAIFSTSEDTSSATAVPWPPSPSASMSVSAAVVSDSSNSSASRVAAAVKHCQAGRKHSEGRPKSTDTGQPHDTRQQPSDGGHSLSATATATVTATRPRPHRPSNMATHSPRRVLAHLNDNTNDSDALVAASAPTLTSQHAVGSISGTRANSPAFLPLSAVSSSAALNQLLRGGIAAADEWSPPSSQLPVPPPPPLLLQPTVADAARLRSRGPRATLSAAALPPNPSGHDNMADSHMSASVVTWSSSEALTPSASLHNGVRAKVSPRGGGAMTEVARRFIAAVANHTAATPADADTATASVSLCAATDQCSSTSASTVTTITSPNSAAPPALLTTFRPSSSEAELALSEWRRRLLSTTTTASELPLASSLVVGCPHSPHAERRDLVERHLSIGARGSAEVCCTQDAISGAVGPSMPDNGASSPLRRLSLASDLSQLSLRQASIEEVAHDTTSHHSEELLREPGSNFAATFSAATHRMAKVVRARQPSALPSATSFGANGRGKTAGQRSPPFAAAALGTSARDPSLTPSCRASVGSRQDTSTVDSSLAHHTSRSLTHGTSVSSSNTATTAVCALDGDTWRLLCSPSSAAAAAAVASLLSSLPDCFPESWSASQSQDPLSRLSLPSTHGAFTPSLSSLQRGASVGQQHRQLTRLSLPRPASTEVLHGAVDLSPMAHTMRCCSTRTSAWTSVTAAASAPAAESVVPKEPAERRDATTAAKTRTTATTCIAHPGTRTATTTTTTSNTSSSACVPLGKRHGKPMRGHAAESTRVPQSHTICGARATPSLLSRSLPRAGSKGSCVPEATDVSGEGKGRPIPHATFVGVAIAENPFATALGNSADVQEMLEELSSIMREALPEPPLGHECDVCGCNRVLPDGRIITGGVEAATVLTTAGEPFEADDNGLGRPAQSGETVARRSSSPCPSHYHPLGLLSVEATLTPSSRRSSTPFTSHTAQQQPTSRTASPTRHHGRVTHHITGEGEGVV